MNYQEWKAEMRLLQIKMGSHFEDALEEHFCQMGNTVTKNPKLPDCKTPDFLVVDQQGRSCYIEAKVLLPPRTEEEYLEITLRKQQGHMIIRDHTRNRLDEKLHLDIDGKYTESNLQRIPLVVAFLDVSLVDLIDLDDEAYGHTTFDVLTRQATKTGEGIWADDRVEFEHRKYIHGLWLWICWNEFSSTHGMTRKPTLATNPWIETDFPDSLTAFNY